MPSSTLGGSNEGCARGCAQVFLIVPMLIGWYGINKAMIRTALAWRGRDVAAEVVAVREEPRGSKVRYHAKYEFAAAGGVHGREIPVDRDFGEQARRALARQGVERGEGSGVATVPVRWVAVRGRVYHEKITEGKSLAGEAVMMWVLMIVWNGLLCVLIFFAYVYPFLEWRRKRRAETARALTR